MPDKKVAEEEDFGGEGHLFKVIKGVGLYPIDGDTLYTVTGVLLDHEFYPQHDLHYAIHNSKGGYIYPDTSGNEPLRLTCVYLHPEIKDEEPMRMIVIVADDFLALSYDEQHELVIATKRIHKMVKEKRLIMSSSVTIFDGKDWSDITVSGREYNGSPGDIKFSELPWIVEAYKGLNIGGPPVQDYRKH